MLSTSRPNFGPKLGPRFPTEFLPPPNYIGKVVAIFMGPWPHCHRLFWKVVLSVFWLKNDHESVCHYQ